MWAESALRRVEACVHVHRGLHQLLVSNGPPELAPARNTILVRVELHEHERKCYTILYYTIPYTITQFQELAAAVSRRAIASSVPP